MNDDVELAYALSAPWAAGIGTVNLTHSLIGQQANIDIDYHRIRNSNSYVLLFKLAWNILMISRIFSGHVTLPGMSPEGKGRIRCSCWKGSHANF